MGKGDGRLPKSGTKEEIDDLNQDKTTGGKGL